MSIDSFHTVILPLKDKLFRLAYSIVRERAEAEDILQDVLLKLWCKRDEWTYIENLEAYCFRITKNAALDKLASMAVRKMGVIDPEKENLYFVENRSPHSEMVRKEQRAAIGRSIEALSENQRLVFTLREIEGMSYREIAEALSISEDLVKISLHRARRNMKEMLSVYHKDE
ncbi:MAG: RNA polymerase sigma factor [Proteiniphilum sp.]|jgi:RNA polymerase sigma-70 factor (ECF subfamily)|nr:RNA polymerase sigma factor [Proteiniphilum sp.]